MPNFQISSPDGALLRIVQNNGPLGAILKQKVKNAMPDTPSTLVCLTTVADQETARKLAKRLLDRRAAACVQIEGPIESHYRWEGRDCCEIEYRLVIKTSVSRKEELREFLREIHPYDQPQILTLQSVDVDPGYSAWVREQTEGGMEGDHELQS
jgi:periplasmic divalent cation tolerance protein